MDSLELDYNNKTLYHWTVLCCKNNMLLHFFMAQNKYIDKINEIIFAIKQYWMSNNVCLVSTVIQIYLPKMYLISFWQKTTTVNFVRVM